MFDICIIVKSLMRTQILTNFFFSPIFQDASVALLPVILPSENVSFMAEFLIIAEKFKVKVGSK